MALALPVAVHATPLRVPPWAAGAVCLTVAVGALAGLVHDAAAAEDLVVDTAAPVSVKVAPLPDASGAVVVTNTGDRALVWRWTPHGSPATAADDGWTSASGRCATRLARHVQAVPAGAYTTSPLAPGASTVLCVPAGVGGVRVDAVAG